MSINEVYLIPNNPTNFDPLSIDRRLEKEPHALEKVHMYCLSLFQNVVIPVDHMLFLYKNILSYYGITSKDICEKYSVPTILNYKKYFFEEIRNILENNTSMPQIVYLEEDFYKIKFILDNQIYIMNEDASYFKLEFILPSNDILIFNDNIKKRKKHNLENIKFIKI